MSNNLLPTEELKKYGIIEEDNSFSKKLTPNDIHQFLNGYTIVADNQKSRVTFNLTENKTQLNVNVYERDKNIQELILNSKEEVQYSNTFSKYNVIDYKNSAQISWTKSAFLFDKENKQVVEYDMIKNAAELTKTIIERNDEKESNIYRNELLKLKSFLLDKIDQYPEISKEIANDVNIVSNEINAINNLIIPNNAKDNENKIQLNVNDPDMYQDALEERENKVNEEDMNKNRGFRR